MLQEIKNSKLSVYKIVNFLNKLGFKLYIVRHPNAIATTYRVLDPKEKKLIFVGNYRSFMRWLASVTEIYEKLFIQELYNEFLKKSDRLN